MSAGIVASLWRYPVKSMQGEPLGAAKLGPRGLQGDRAYALVDLATGHVASAKHPGKWAALLACRAAYAAEPAPGAPLPPVLITLPGGSVISSADRGCDAALSQALGCNEMGGKSAAATQSPKRIFTIYQSISAMLFLQLSSTKGEYTAAGLSGRYLHADANR